MISNKDWPISPTFLSLRYGCKEEDAKYNRDGIYYPDYLRGFLADLSHDERIQNALMLFQFVPENFTPNDPNADNATETDKGTVLFNYPIDERIRTILNGRKIIRIESGTFINNGRRCACFRGCKIGNKDFCYKQDSIVGIFADEELDTFYPNSIEYCQKLNNIIKSFNKGRDNINKIKIESLEIGDEQRLYVHYTCPKSLYEEHIFPIYAQGHIIACLVLGQMARDSFDEKKSFIEDRKGMEEYEEAKKKTKEVNPSAFEYKITILSQKEWDKKASAVLSRVQIFEKRLEEKIEHRNTRYINDAFEGIERHFRIKVNSINIKKQDTFNKFSEALSEALTIIKHKFDNNPDGFFRIFALSVDIEHGDLIPIGCTDRESTETSDFKMQKDMLELNFSLEKLKELDATSEYEQKGRIIQEAASQKIKELYEKHDVLLPGWLAGGEVAYIVWERHSKELRGNITDNTFAVYKKNLRHFYSIALEYYSYIRGARMESLLKTTLQESAHESAHFILPSIDVVTKHLKILPQKMIRENYEDFYKKYKDDFERYRKEVLESLNQLNSINSGSSLILSPSLKINKKITEVFYLLYKLKKIFDVRASDSYKQIYYKQDEDGVRANIDESYFNHALYNLLDNAIKYGHEGSNIYIHMSVDRKRYLMNIKIISYGIGIPEEEEERVYDLFERGTEASNRERGTGLGMYIVKKICEAHGGTVSHISKKLSELNIPVLLNYKNIIADLTSGDIEKFEKEISALSTIQYEVVNNRNFIEYDNVFWNRLYTPTYKNTFTMTIPLN